MNNFKNLRLRDQILLSFLFQKNYNLSSSSFHSCHLRYNIGFVVTNQTFSQCCCVGSIVSSSVFHCGCSAWHAKEFERTIIFHSKQKAKFVEFDLCSAWFRCSVCFEKSIKINDLNVFDTCRLRVTPPRKIGIKINVAATTVLQNFATVLNRVLLYHICQKVQQFQRHKLNSFSKTD